MADIIFVLASHNKNNDLQFQYLDSKFGSHDSELYLHFDNLAEGKYTLCVFI